MSTGRPVVRVSEHHAGWSVSSSSYKQGCRCDGCRTAERVRVQRRREVMRERMPVHHVLPLRPPEGWRELAMCPQFPSEFFFAAKGESSRNAKRVCAICPVTAECLAEALSESRFEMQGVWGGTTLLERRHLRGWVS